MTSGVLAGAPSGAGVQAVENAFSYTAVQRLRSPIRIEPLRKVLPD